MPFPLPWFKNKVDPLLPQPQNIKPFLYAWDDYQTYDVLWFIPVDWFFYETFFGAVYTYLPVPNFRWIKRYPPPGGVQVSHFEDFVIPVNRPFGFTLFDRFTPWNYAWAEGYSTKLFYFIKQYCFPFFGIWADSIQPNFVVPNFDSRKSPRFKYAPNLSHPQSLSLTIKIEEAQTIVLTWLEHQHHGSFLGESYCETTKKYRSFNLQKGENTIKLGFSDFFCACSMVVLGEKDVAEIEKEIDKINQGILYKNLDKLLEEIENYFTYAYKNVRQGFSSVPYPNEYYYATLIYANNNYWGNPINIELDKDLGKPIYCTPSYSNDHTLTNIGFNLWGAYTLWLITDSPGIPNLYQTAVGIDNFQSNLYKKFTFESGFELFSTEEFEGFNTSIESFLVTKGIAIPSNVVISFLDARKKLELQDA